MKIALKWVNELINIETINLENLIEKLTLGGFEVEEIIEINLNNKKVITLDISSTANRSDSLCIQGISLEIAALINKSVNVSKYSTTNFHWKQQIKNLPELFLPKTICPTFIALTVENLTNLQVPKWLTQKLISSGILPNNNLLDFQNYILLETGHPFEFYDLDKIYSKLNNLNFKLNITNNTESEKFYASNGLNYELNDSIVTVKANDLSISIGGVISNKHIAYCSSTTSLLIEGSIFNSAKIRQQSRILGLRTDRSAKYEKSLKNTNLIESYYRLISLLRISNPSLNCKLHTIAQTIEKNTEPIYLKYSNVNQILGPIKDRESKNNKHNYISVQLISDYLKRLRFTINYDENNLTWKVYIPNSRSDDIIREIDLIEEIGRLHGFNNFLTQLPKIKTIGIEDSSYKTRKKLTACFTNLGFNELIHYSLVNQKTYVNNEIKLINPLLKDCSNLRSSLLPSLIETVYFNSKNGNKVIEGFEYGHLFSNNVLRLFREREYVAGIFGGVEIKSTWSGSPKVLDWFEAKGRIEELFKKLNLLVYWKPCLTLNKNTILHPYSSSKLFLNNGENLGVFGQIHPILSKKLNLSTNIYLFEFDLALIKNEIENSKLKIYKEYSVYPKIVKDLSFVVSNKISFEKLKKTLYSNGSKFLIQINLLDEYRGGSIPNGYSSLCLQLTFQSDEKTLQNKYIENIVNNLQKLLIDKFNVNIRI